MKRREEQQLLEGYAAIAASMEYQEEHRRKMALHEKQRAVWEFEQRFNIDIRDYLAAETTKKTRTATRRKKNNEQ